MNAENVHNYFKREQVFSLFNLHFKSMYFLIFIQDEEN